MTSGNKKFAYGSETFNRLMKEYLIDVAQFCLDFNCRAGIFLKPEGENCRIIGAPSPRAFLHAANLHNNSLPVPPLTEEERIELRTFLDQLKNDDAGEGPALKKAKKTKSSNGGVGGNSAHGPKDNDASGSGKGCSV